MSFAQYMELALYAPGLGYYSAGLSKLGPAGDFVTAPEISPLFGRCIARQCSRILAELRGGEILELGAGSGRLAADLLLEMERLESLPGPAANSSTRFSTPPVLHDPLVGQLARGQVHRNHPGQRGRGCSSGASVLYHRSGNRRATGRKWASRAFYMDQRTRRRARIDRAR